MPKRWGKLAYRLFYLLLQYLPVTINQKKQIWYQFGLLCRRIVPFWFDDLSMKKVLLEKYTKSKITEEQRYLYQKRLNSLRSLYERIYILRPAAMNMGNMCVNYWYIKLITEQKKKNELIVLMNYDREEPIFSFQHKMVANQYFYKKIAAMIETMDESNAAFWGYALKNTKGYISCRILREQFFFLEKPYMPKHIAKTQYPQKNYIEYSAEEQETGRNILERLGCKEKEYYCFFSRNNDYHGVYYNDAGERAKNITTKRNSAIEDFLFASKMLFQAGIKAVRVGALDFRKIESETIIDYTNTVRSEFMDFYLMGQAKFFLGDPSGIMYIPLLQNVPLALTNNLSVIWNMEYISNYNNAKCLSIYKKWYDTNKGRYLTFREILQLNERQGLSTENEIQFYYDRGIEFHANTAEEICDLALEMNARLDGKWKDSSEILTLREKYWNIVNKALEKAPYQMMLLDYEPGSSFLLKNQWLLE